MGGLSAVWSFEHLRESANKGTNSVLNELNIDFLFDCSCSENASSVMPLLDCNLVLRDTGLSLSKIYLSMRVVG